MFLDRKHKHYEVTIHSSRPVGYDKISRVQMSPISEETSFPTNGNGGGLGGLSKKATYTLMGIKFLELFLLICCIGLIDEPSVNSNNTRIFITPRVAALCYVTFGCLLIYTAIYIIMTLFGDITPWRTAALWNLIAFILFVVTTWLLFRNWSNIKDLNYWHPNMHRLDMILAAASISLITTIVYLIDILLTIRFGVNGDLE